MIKILIEKVRIVKPVTVWELRILSGKNQRAFSKAVGIPYGTYAKKEQGISRFFDDEVRRISKYTKVPLEMIESTYLEDK